MKAVGLYEYLPAENPESLQDVEVNRPSAAGHDILVEVKAVSINPVDTKIRSPKEGKEESPRILGWDAAGTVTEVGEAVTLFKPGDDVYYAGSVDRQGSNADFQLVDERIAASKPESLDYAEAAAMPLTTITAWEGLFERLGIPKDPQTNKDRTILVIGAAGGVGSIAVQLAKWAGLTVIGTASREETSNWAESLGADYIINHHEDMGEQVRALGFNEVDNVFCLNSTHIHFPAAGELVKPQGGFCSIVESPEELDMNILKNKSAYFAWEFMFTRPLYQTDDMIEQHNLLTEAAALFESGELKTTLTERKRPLEADVMRAAHQRVEEGSMIGKLVVER
ncbi:zinc-binding alcohol dehydrogenase family protein [Alkalicoccus chagannorensis]|uniref:zinc-binding alcohol dehydrogenase family protein n=1 Tax=Alkalicoccus chagannorensis TaxID=427072 RepID=UPI0004211E29|nr:zinc-binding alcohol dehydrogenase family protein [Alkalicoccus chagannorensis]